MCAQQRYSCCGLFHLKWILRTKHVPKFLQTDLCLTDYGWNFQRKCMLKEAQGLLLPITQTRFLGSRRALNQLVTFASSICFGQLFKRTLSKAPQLTGSNLGVFLLLEADEVDSEDSSEPPHKRLCLSEDDQSLDDSTPCISVVAVPSKFFYVLLQQIYLLVKIRNGLLNQYNILHGVFYFQILFIYLGIIFFFQPWIVLQQLVLAK